MTTSYVGHLGHSLPSTSQTQRISRSSKDEPSKSGIMAVENQWDRYKAVDRSAWWKSTIKDTPNPGIYTCRDFLQEMERNPIKNSYRFKSVGRKPESSCTERGQDPGAYNNDSIDMHFWLKKTMNSYGFKNLGRQGENLLNEGLVDKDIDIGPGEYNNEYYLSIDGEKHPSKYVAFRSRTRRVIPAFQPKDGPAPGEYDNVIPPAKEHPVRSSFQSHAPRFRTSHTRNPGPGSYDQTYQSPMPATIMKMGRQHGLFFSSAFHS